MKENRTAVIVLNWNGAPDTLACLASLAKVSHPDFATVVVDNGSTDGSVELVRRAFPGVEVVGLPRNLGFAAGCNAGFAALRGRGFDTVVFLNNDTIVDEGFLEPLVEALREPWNGIAVPKILYMDDPGRIWYAGGIVVRGTGLIAHRGIRMPDGPEFSVAGPTRYATGCCLSMRSADFEALGGFDEGFLMYGEDVDLSLRVREMGQVVRYEPASRIWHRVSASSGGELSLGRQLRKSRAALRIMRRHRMWRGLLLYPLLLPFRSAASLLKLAIFNRARVRKARRA
ncbi:MAG: glycosyltransferase family 2 protein [Chlorobiaceae bacterium]|nr:glycosyltransferase family 2 protein [Chlorobiaceae bacterium]